MDETHAAPLQRIAALMDALVSCQPDLLGDLSVPVNPDQVLQLLECEQGRACKITIDRADGRSYRTPFPVFA